MTHPRAPKGFVQGKTEIPSFEVAILSTNWDDGQAHRALLSAGTIDIDLTRDVTSSSDASPGPRSTLPSCCVLGGGLDVQQYTFVDVVQDAIGNHVPVLRRRHP